MLDSLYTHNHAFIPSDFNNQPLNEYLRIINKCIDIVQDSFGMFGRDKYNVVSIVNGDRLPTR